MISITRAQAALIHGMIYITRAHTSCTDSGDDLCTRAQAALTKGMIYIARAQAALTLGMIYVLEHKLH